MGFQQKSTSAMQRKQSGLLEIGTWLSGVATGSCSHSVIVSVCFSRSTVKILSATRWGLLACRISKVRCQCFSGFEFSKYPVFPRELRGIQWLCRFHCCQHWCILAHYFGFGHPITEVCAPGSTASITFSNLSNLAARFPRIYIPSLARDSSTIIRF